MRHFALPSEGGKKNPLKFMLIKELDLFIQLIHAFYSMTGIAKYMVSYVLLFQCG